jgi:hypothetical protein
MKKTLWNKLNPPDDENGIDLPFRTPSLNEVGIKTNV